MTKTFPADFYVTCATVIPVLFIALQVQGGTHDEMLVAAQRAHRRRPKRLRDYAAFTWLPVLPYLSLMAGVIGEWGALGSLFDQSDQRSTRVLVFVMTLYLVVLTAVGPARKWARVYAEVNDRAREDLIDEGQEPAAPAD